MYEKFIKYIEENYLINNSQSVLLAVSGGVDSMVMLDLFRKTNYNIGVAHCNFKLRGKESDDDEEFVRNKANDFNIPIYSVHFDTEKYANKKGISIQMAARELRYNWFEEIRDKNKYDLIAIAHNGDDVIETFLSNLIRGTGIKGLTGIKPKNDLIIRPILDFYRSEILYYADYNEINYREDSSNNSVKYKRNFIRHEIIPLFEKLNPDVKITISETIQKLKDVEEIYRQKIESTKKQAVKIENGNIIISVSELKKLNPLKPYLFEYLKPFGFSNDSLERIIENGNKQSGKIFYSEKYQLLIDRKNLIISKKVSKGNPVFYIKENDKSIDFLIKLNLKRFDRDDSFSVIKNEKIAQVDFSKLTFPLKLRKWNAGDFFYPLGMKRQKKVSDFFIDLKMSRLEKEEAWILESANEIVWIIGKRIDNRYKVTEKTKVILEITWLK
ncbi:MAG: tRNA lysidine(34) synthetase TilS [Chlorobi bacterium]|nr:tRNA lysidine(34) synthetase TilS [Chlorobiota bacterium]